MSNLCVREQHKLCNKPVTEVSVVSSTPMTASSASGAGQ